MVTPKVTEDESEPEVFRGTRNKNIPLDIYILGVIAAVITIGIAIFRPDLLLH